ncbi:MAG: hypothetical protein K8J08_16205, partial [Thermoanaerobaculia bacterium]|nr:hypothetical protein [Thermoanaerobaculia bacterium]
MKYLFGIAVLLLLTVTAAFGDLGVDIPEDELIVRLAPYPDAPRPTEVVEAIRDGRFVPGGLGVGTPIEAEFLLPARLRGRMAAVLRLRPPNSPALGWSVASSFITPA